LGQIIEVTEISKSVAIIPKKYFIPTVETALYGFFGGASVWTCLYLIYEMNLSIIRNDISRDVNMSFWSFPIDFFGFCIGFATLALLIRLISRFLLPTKEHLFASWLWTGLISIAALNLILSSAPVPLLPETVGFGWICCLDNSAGYLLWILTFLIVAVYTILFDSIRKLVNRSAEPLE
jgi:hypothetical protein